MELNSIYKNKYLKYKKKYLEKKTLKGGAGRFTIDDFGFTGIDKRESEELVEDVSSILQRIKDKQFSKISDYLKKKKSNHEAVIRNPIIFLKVFLKVLSKNFLDLIKINGHNNIIKTTFEGVLDDKFIVFVYFSEEENILLSSLYRKLGINLNIDPELIRKILEAEHTKTPIQAIVPIPFTIDNKITLIGLSKIKAEINQIINLCAQENKKIKGMSIPVISCELEEFNNENLIKKKTSYLDNLYLLAGHGSEDNAFEINLSNEIIPKSPNLIRLDGYYKFVRITYYGDSTENGWGDFFYCLFSYKSNLKNNTGVEFSVDQIIKNFAKQLTNIDSRNLIECIANLLIELNIKIFNKFIEGIDDETLITFIITEENIRDFESIKADEDNLWVELRKRLMGWVDINELILLINYLIKNKIEGDISYIEQWCHIKSREMYDRLSVTDTVISDMDLDFDLDGFRSKAGIFSRDILINNDSEISKLCGFDVGNVNGLYSHQFKYRITNIKLSELINSGKYKNDKFSIAGLPPGTYFMAVCRVENSLIQNVMKDPLSYEPGLTTLMDDEDKRRYDEQNKSIREKITNFILENAEYKLYEDKIEIIIYFYKIFRRHHNFISKPDNNVIKFLFDKYINDEFKITEERLLSDADSSLNIDKGVERLMALRELSNQRQDEINLTPNLVNEDLDEVIQEEIIKYNKVLNKFNGKDYNIIFIKPEQMYIRYKYLDVLKGYTDLKLKTDFINIFSNNAKQSIPDFFCNIISDYDCKSSKGGMDEFPSKISIPYDNFISFLSDGIKKEVYCIFILTLKLILKSSVKIEGRNINFELNFDEYKVLKHILTDYINLINI